MLESDMKTVGVIMSNQEFLSAFKIITLSATAGTIVTYLIGELLICLI